MRRLRRRQQDHHLHWNIYFKGRLDSVGMPIRPSAPRGNLTGPPGCCYPHRTEKQVQQVGCAEWRRNTKERLERQL